VSSLEYHREYNKRRYYKVRAEAIQLLGGKCNKCGSAEELEIDHVDRKQKSFEISKIWALAREKFLAELAKCQLLCKSCHRIKSIGELGKKPATHGTLSMYRYCKCDACKQAKSDWMKAYKLRRRSTVGSAPDL
jgi:ribosomal protein S27AE